MKKETKLYCSKIGPEDYNKEEMITEIPENVFCIDGYLIADRLLEGVMFEVHFKDKKVLSVSLPPDWTGVGYDISYWKQKVKEYAEDILQSGDEVELPYDLRKKYFVNGINVSFVTDEKL